MGKSPLTKLIAEVSPSTPLNLDRATVIAGKSTMSIPCGILAHDDQLAVIVVPIRAHTIGHVEVVGMTSVKADKVEKLTEVAHEHGLMLTLTGSQLRAVKKATKLAKRAKADLKRSLEDRLDQWLDDTIEDGNPLWDLVEEAGSDMWKGFKTVEAFSGVFMDDNTIQKRLDEISAD